LSNDLCQTIRGDAPDVIQSRIAGEILERRDQAGMNTKEAAAWAFNNTYGAYPFLAPYFRMLYHLFNLIDDEQSLTLDDRERYASMVRAQLDDWELRLLFYNCTVGEGKAGLMRYVLKYGLLKNISPAYILDEAHREMFYPAAAFESAATRAATKTA
jgi:hypothetical protein